MRRLSLSILVWTSFIVAGPANAQVTSPRKAEAIPPGTDASVEIAEKDKLSCRSEDRLVVDWTVGPGRPLQERADCGAPTFEARGGGGTQGVSYPGSRAEPASGGAGGSSPSAWIGGGSSGSVSSTSSTASAPGLFARASAAPGPGADNDGGGSGRWGKPGGDGSDGSPPNGPGVAVPGPAVGAGLPGILAVLGYWAIRRRAARQLRSA